MASLVADYSDSDDEDYQNEEVATTTVSVKEEPKDPVKEEPRDATEKTGKPTNFFATAENESNSEDESNEGTATSESNTVVKQEQKLPNPLTAELQKLPSLNEAATSRIGTSVFVNPFEEAEQAKNQILEKHVRLTEAAPKKPAHQPVCWKFKKGKCFLGKNCRFFHDRDNIALEENNAANAEPPSPNSNTVENPNRPSYHSSAFRNAGRHQFQPEPVDDDNYMASMKRKRRYGVNDHLVPPKKAFESLQRQRIKERPWTMGGKAP
ncbi:uncharacterized protein LOC101862453 [Aplysia californica]|uniref:Uncharacterized protein LOC101862453 n=1 Tax=Aplysia californica TaxID=6500 RepID=A0ABM0K5B5_APLCA|nr:uncharacterized protein LOC101862453 [Aplysia californica]